MLIGRIEPVKIKDLADLFGVTHAAAARIVHHLWLRGWARRIYDGTRARPVALTEVASRWAKAEQERRWAAAKKALETSAG